MALQARGSPITAQASSRDYVRQIFWGSGSDLPNEGLLELLEPLTLEALELPAGAKAILSLSLPKEHVNEADSQTIFTTEAVAHHPEVQRLLQASGIVVTSTVHQVRGISDQMTLYEIP